MLVFLDKFFIVFHASLVGFILFGWIWKKTRKVNLVIGLLTAFSWFGLGIWYGLGYCPFTDWHFQVRRQLGYVDNSSSFIKYLIDHITGTDLAIQTVDMISLVIFLSALSASIYINWKDWRQSKMSGQTDDRLKLNAEKSGRKDESHGR
ncbi:MAG: DUF2784 domain-containing protein [bacterium]